MTDDVHDEGISEDQHSHRHLYEHEDGPLSTAVVFAVADADGVDPLDMDPIYGAVQSDVVDAFAAAGADFDGELTFSYHGYSVTVNADREILLTPDASSDPR